MKAKANIMSIILLLSVFIILASCKQQKTEWQGTIEDVDGVTVVKNPKEPLSNEPLFTIEEELSIGKAEGEEEYIFSQVRAIGVDNQEQIYALDIKNAHIKVIDKNGVYLRTVGKKGEGPGEINVPVDMFISAQNEIIVDDIANNRFSYYSQDGEFIKSVSTAKMRIGRTGIDSKGNFFGMTIDPQNRIYELKKFDSNLNFLFTFADSPLPDPIQVNLFPFIVRYAIDSADNIIIMAEPEKYQIDVLDPEGNLVRRIERDFTSVEISQEEIDERKKTARAAREYYVPKFHPAFQDFALDEDNKIYVRTWEETEDGTGYFCDVFDSEGKYITKIPLKIRPRIWKKGKLYSLEEDEEGFHVIKRYKVHWKS